jgi:UDP-N-acetylmuramate dehydrogenase
MNAGGHGSDMAASLASIRVVDMAAGQTREMAAGALGLSYRHTDLPATCVVTSATLRLAHGDVEAAEAEVAESVRWRREHQPGGANAGSVFTNPEGDSAGRLVDVVGGKGLTVGSAAVSEKHANFVQAAPGGSADDVAQLMLEVADLVERGTGVRLRAETRMAGFDPELLADLGATAADGWVEP